MTLLLVDDAAATDHRALCSLCMFDQHPWTRPELEWFTAGDGRQVQLLRVYCGCLLCEPPCPAMEVRPYVLPAQDLLPAQSRTEPHPVDVAALLVAGRALATVPLM